jgi:hypothetical protein
MATTTPSKTAASSRQSSTVGLGRVSPPFRLNSVVRLVCTTETTGLLLKEERVEFCWVRA